MQRGFGHGNFNRSLNNQIQPEINDLELEMEILQRKKMLLMRERELFEENRSCFEAYPSSTSMANSFDNQNFTSGFSHMYEYKRGAKRRNPSVWQNDYQQPQKLMNFGANDMSYFDSNLSNYMARKNSGPARNSNQRKRAASPVRPRPPQKKPPPKFPQKNNPKQIQNNPKQNRNNSFNSQNSTFNSRNNSFTTPNNSFNNPKKRGQQNAQSRNSVSQLATPSPQSKVPKGKQSQTPFIRKVPDNKKKPNQTTDNANDILYADKKTSPIVMGRLELALGTLLKELKEEYIAKDKKYEYLFRGLSFSYCMKQTVRSRIREVMLGKVVTSSKQIIEQYRKLYPKDTDASLVASAEEKEEARRKNHLAVGLCDEENPELYFKLNFNLLLDVELDVLFKKLHKFIEEEEKLEIEKTSEQTIVKSEVENGGNIPTSDDIVTIEDEEDEREKPSEKEKDGASGKTIEQMVVEALKRHLPRTLPKYKDLIIKVLDVRQMFWRTKQAIITNTQEMLKKGQQTAHVDETVEKDVEKNTSEHHYTRKDVDINKGDIEQNSEAKVDVKGPIKTNAPTLPYYVKIIGRPALADRNAMMAFLKQFQPKSVKKHNTIDNLLFVGFESEENFQKILNANGSAVGDVTLMISCQRISATDAPRKVEEEPAKEAKEQESKVAYESDDDVQIVETSKSNANEQIVISDELESEISDMLRSIQSDADLVAQNGNREGNSEKGPQESDNSKVAEGNRDDGDVQTVEDEVDSGSRPGDQPAVQDLDQ